MITKTICSTLLLCLCCIPTLAQERFEVQPFVGYKFGGGTPVSSNDLDINRINFNSSAAAGVAFGINATETFGLEFLWNRQPTQVHGRLNDGGKHPEQFDAKLDQFHGNLLFNFNPDEKLRPFILLGLGATRAASSDASKTNFSFALGGGIKYFFTENMGVRLQARYTPTYLFTTSGGTWCNWWGVCWVVPNDHYMNQADVTVGWIFSF
jgi:opacity protein-like surface antigen